MDYNVQVGTYLALGSLPDIGSPEVRPHDTERRYVKIYSQEVAVGG